MKHYTKAQSGANFTSGKYGVSWKDSVCAGLSFGYKHYWELGVSCEAPAREGVSPML